MKRKKRRGRNRWTNPRLSTLKRDARILQLIAKGFSPKEAAHKLGLSSVWVAYDAVKRNRGNEKKLGD